MPLQEYSKESYRQNSRPSSKESIDQDLAQEFAGLLSSPSKLDKLPNSSTDNNPQLEAAASPQRPTLSSRSSSGSGSLNQRLAKLSSPKTSSAFWASQTVSPPLGPLQGLDQTESALNDDEHFDVGGFHKNSSQMHRLNMMDQPTLASTDANGALMKDEDGTSSSDEEDDESFANVDEMDGPISPSNSSDEISNLFLKKDKSNSVPSSPVDEKPHFFNKHSQKKDFTLKQFADSKEQVEKGPVKLLDTDCNLPVDHDLQKQLERRALEIMESAKNNKEKSSDYECVYQPITKPVLHWEHKDSYYFEHEISLWFYSFGNLNIMEELRNCEKQLVYSYPFPEHQFNDIAKMSQICYFAVGFFNHCTNLETLERTIKLNNWKLLKHLSKEVLASFKQHAILCRDEKTHLAEYAKLLKYSATALYFMIAVAIDERKKENKSQQKIIDTFCDEIDNLELLEFLLEYVEHWRWSCKLSMHIRSILLILNKLIVLQFGNEIVYENIHDEICQSYDIPNTKKHLKQNKQYSKQGKESPESHKLASHAKHSLKTTPSQFEAFREDITSRYPTAVMKPILDYKYGESTSLTQFIDIPRPKKKYASNTGLPEPQHDIQLSGRNDTPFPSPSSSPKMNAENFQRNDGSFKKSNGKKSFQTNLNYPFMFPAFSDSLQNSPNVSETVLPYNVQEAVEIMRNNIHFTLQDHQLASEKLLFMQKERGCLESHKLEGASDIKNFDQYNLETLRNNVIMARIEKLYQKTLPNFNSLIAVIMQLMELNLNEKKYDTYANDSQKRSYMSKQVTLSAGVSILFLLARWFKLSHVCKFQYFASLLYDAKFIEMSTKLMEVSFTVDRYNSIFKKISDCTFWHECEKIYGEGDIKGSSGCLEFYSEDDFEFELGKAISRSSSESEANHHYDDEEDVNLVYLDIEYCTFSLLQQVLGSKTQRLKFLPLNIGITFKKLYQIFNLQLYDPLLSITKELTPFKSKKWKSEHMDLISGVYLYQDLSLVDNWVTGKDTSAEINDAYSEEFALRTLLQFYNFRRYQDTMKYLGYSEKPTGL
ncbi:hypothetical protein ACO0QE_001089 [Hanseniaspora vineae]